MRSGRYRGRRQGEDQVRACRAPGVDDVAAHHQRNAHNDYGITRPAEDAFRTALAEMVLWLEEDYDFSRGEAYLFLGQVLEARCTQFVNPTFSYVAKVNRKYLPSG